MSDAAATTTPHEHHDHRPLYMKVFYGLIVLTVVEVGLAFVTVPALKPLVVASMVMLALAKAALVAGFFMHLKFDSKALMIVVLSPIVLSALLFIAPILDGLCKVWGI